MRSLQTIQVPFVLKTELRSVRAFSTVTRLGYFWKVSGYFWKVSGYFWTVLAACFLAKIVQIFGHFQGLFLKIPLSKSVAKFWQILEKLGYFLFPTFGHTGHNMDMYQRAFKCGSYYLEGAT